VAGWNKVLVADPGVFARQGCATNSCQDLPTDAGHVDSIHVDEGLGKSSGYRMEVYEGG